MRIIFTKTFIKALKNLGFSDNEIESLIKKYKGEKE